MKRLKRLEYTRFATVTIIVAQVLAGISGVVSIIAGMMHLDGESWEGVKGIAAGIVSLGIFFALARVQMLDDPDQKG